MNNIIHITCAADSSYLQHAYVMLHSLFCNNKNELIIVHFFSSDLTQNDKLTLNKLIDKNHAEINYYQISNNDFKDFKITHHVSLATYYRIIIPQLLDKNIDKFLYLDCDMIINGSLNNLWQTKFNGNILAAVPEPTFNEYNRIQIDEKYGYFNAGVLLVNNSLWKTNNTTQKVIQYIQNNLERITFWDQDALNACLYNTWLKLPAKFNQQSALFITSNLQLLKTYQKSELTEAINNPVIIHYTGSSKPWQLNNYHRYKYLYWYYLKQTPFAHYKIKDKNFILAIKEKLIYFLTPVFKKRIGLIK